MASLRHLKDLFARCSHDIHAATVALNETTRKMEKLQKLRIAYNNIIIVRSEELRKLKEDIEKIQKQQIQEGGISRWANLFRL